MIRANKSRPWSWLLSRYLHAKVAGAFGRVWVRGELPATGSVLLYANHSSFWDGFIAHLLAREARLDGYCLMEEKNLSRYRFLSRLGAFSIRRGEGRSATESLRYAGKLLRRPRTAVLVFPEGELRVRPELPLRLDRGVEVLARLAQVRCVPVGLRYAFFGGEKPEVVVELGPSHAAGALELFSAGLSGVVREVEAVRTFEGHRALVSGRRGAAARWDAVRGLADG